MNKKKPLGLAKLLALSLATLSPALAQDSGADIDEIVVSATGIPTPISQIGSSVDVITGAELERQQITYLQDALKLKGINVPQTGSFGSLSNVFMRGLPGKYTDLVVDGISLFDPRSNQVLWSDVIADGVEQIEILRGAQGVLYGSNTIAGVVSQSTEMGGAPETSLRLEVGDFGTTDFSITSKGEITNAAYGLVLGAVNTDGFSAAAENLGDNEADGYENNRANGRAEIYLTEFMSLEFAARFNEGEAESDAQFSRTDELGKFETFERQASRVGLVFEGDDSRQVVSVTDYQSSVEEFVSNVRAASREADREVLGYRGVFDLANASRLVIGTDQLSESFTDGNKNEIDVASVYALLQSNVGDSMVVTGAIREDDHNSFGKQETYRVTLAYSFDSRSVFRVAHGSGFRAPSLTELFLDFYGNENLKPETSISTEVGLDVTLSSSTDLGLTFYQSEIEDVIGYDPMTYVNRQINGTSQISGAEISLTVAANKVWKFHVDASYTDSEKPSGDGSGFEREVRVPRLQSSLNVNYTPNERLNLSVMLRQVRGVVDVNDETLDDYTLLNLNAAYQISDAVKGYGRIENAADEEYETAKGYGTPGRGAYIGVSTTF